MRLRPRELFVVEVVDFLWSLVRDDRRDWDRPRRRCCCCCCASCCCCCCCRISLALKLGLACSSCGRDDDVCCCCCCLEDDLFLDLRDDLGVTDGSRGGLGTMVMALLLLVLSVVAEDDFFSLWVCLLCCCTRLAQYSC